MENQNVDGNAAEIAALKARMRKLQEEQTQKNSSSKKSKEDLLSKYFTPSKPTEIFRILPPKTGREFYEIAFFHVVDVNTASGYKKKATIYCPKHNNPKVPRLDANGNPVLDGNGKPIMDFAPCPLCDKHDKILSSQDPSVKFRKKETLNDYELKILASNTEVLKKANEWKAKKFYIIKGIDKGQSKDGVKFWRFKENFNGEGVWEKLFPIVNLYVNNKSKDFTSEVDGCDLTILTQKKEDKRTHKPYTHVSVISTGEPSALHSDHLVAEGWVKDPLTWRDVFKPKVAPNITAYEFMEMIISGTDPYWNDVDANNKHWVFPGRPDLQEKANTRKRDLNATSENIETASDVDYVAPVTISNITESKVGKFVDNSVDVGAQIMSEKKTPVVIEEVDEETTYVPEEVDGADDYSDLPF
jgi:hypothetical protein